MAPTTFSWKSTLPFPVRDVFAWHTRPGAFDRLNPPWRPVTIIQAPSSLESGSQVSIRLPIIGPLSLRWDLTHTGYVDGVEFCDEQVRGPFHSWKHRHRFVEVSPRSTDMIDEISYKLPWYARPLAHLCAQELARLFAFRHAQLASDIELHNRWAAAPRKKIIIAGSSGFIGSALTSFLSTAGHSVIQLIRRKPETTDERYWDPERGILDPSIFNEVDVVINLAGEPLLGRWSNKKKQSIKESRVKSAALIARTIASLQKPPEVAIMSSAIGIYGDTHNTHADESSRSGSGFLADVCAAWENASQPIAHSSCRLVNLRIGTVLNARGGALKQMLLSFRMGLGGPLGLGSQYMSWIGMSDLLGMIEHIIYSPAISGPFNAVAPLACTNRQFAEALGHVLRRPTILRVPGATLRLVFGELADSMLLCSSRVLANKSLSSGYSYLRPDLQSTIAFECGVSAST